MGKAKILSELEPGRYRIELDTGQQRQQLLLDQISQLITGAESRLSELLTQAETQGIERAEAASAQAAALTAFNAATDGNKQKSLEALNKASIALETINASIRTTERSIANTEMRKAALELDKERIAAIDTRKTLAAWCTDGTIELTGNVGTVEVPGEPNAPILVRPGYEDGAQYEAAKDGQLLNRHLMTGAQAFFNAALLPGWQKWRPYYRFGEITKIDYEQGICNIELEPQRSSAQDLNVNQVQTLSNVPAKYQNCDMDAFEEGDEVLIQLQGNSWESPLVIGFKYDPRPCALPFYFCIPGAVGYANSALTLLPPEFNGPGPFVGGTGMWAYQNHLCVHANNVWKWETYADFYLVRNGQVLIDINGTGYGGYPRTGGIPAVAATKTHIWSAHVEYSSAGDLGTVCINQFLPDGSHVMEQRLPNSSGDTYLDFLGASGMLDKVMFHTNEAIGFRVDITAMDTGTVFVTRATDNYDIPESGAHGFGLDRIETRRSSVVLYPDGAGIDDGITIAQPGTVGGVAMQEKFIAVALRDSGRLLLYDRESLLLLTEYQASGGGLVTVDAARMK